MLNQCFFAITTSPLNKGVYLRYNKSKSLLLKDTLCYSLDEIGLVVGETKVLQCCQVSFAISLLSPQRKWLGLRFHWKSLHIELLCAKYGWDWLCGSGKEDVLCRGWDSHTQPPAYKANVFPTGPQPRPLLFCFVKCDIGISNHLFNQ